jgi:hypothetical protein
MNRPLKRWMEPAKFFFNIESPKYRQSAWAGHRSWLSVHCNVISGTVRVNVMVSCIACFVKTVVKNSSYWANTKKTLVSFPCNEHIYFALMKLHALYNATTVSLVNTQWDRMVKKWILFCFELFFYVFSGKYKSSQWTIRRQKVVHHSIPVNTIDSIDSWAARMS